MRVLVVGRGRVGKGLARALRPSDLRVGTTSGRRPRAASVRGADAVVLAVPDGAIADTARRIAPWVDDRTAVLHCAGARGPGELDACRRAGAEVGAMHPMVSFPSPGRSPSLRGTSFVIAGTAGAVRAARRIARAAGARPVVAPVHGPAYHAAAALVANGGAALATVGVGLLERLGMTREDAQRTAGTLLRTVADNVEHIGVPAALTGPIMRGDADTVERHREALRGVDRRALDAYDRVAPIVLRVARAAGLSPARVRRVRGKMRG